MRKVKITCPRRMHEFGPWQREEKLDHWRRGTSFVKHERDRTWRNCSFCGSVDPKQVLAAVRAGEVVLGPTDKNYKAYVEGVPTGEMYELGGKQVERPGESIGKLYFQHFDQDDITEFIELYNSKVMKIGYPGHFYTRPFFVAEV